jgi:sulfonate transport system ATP-binding protein
MMIIERERPQISGEVAHGRIENLPAPGGAAAIRIRGLEKSFGGNRVLRGIDLDIPAGQFVAVVGKSGCGKSTLLRVIMGLETPTQGRLSFGDTDGDATMPNARIVLGSEKAWPRKPQGRRRPRLCRKFSWRRRPGNGRRGFPAARSSAWHLPAHS